MLRREEVREADGEVVSREDVVEDSLEGWSEGQEDGWEAQEEDSDRVWGSTEDAWASSLFSRLGAK